MLPFLNRVEPFVAVVAGAIGVVVTVVRTTG
jgi:hypothetical protein